MEGEDKLQAVLREIEEETGINEGICEEIYSLVHEGYHAIHYGYLFVTSFDKKRIRLQEGETIDYKWITKTELIEFYKTDCSPTLKERFFRGGVVRFLRFAPVVAGPRSTGPRATSRA